MARYKVKGKDCQLKVKVKLSFKEEIDERQLDFFSSKYIRGLLKVQAKKKNCIEFYGPIGISLFDRLKKPISKYDFFFIMEQVIDITQKANLNSLILRNIVWDIHYVFINETKEDKIRIVLDNLKVHTSEATRKYLVTVPERFEFVFTPKHGSWLNMVEGFFSKTTRQMLRGIRVKFKEELTNRIYRYFAEINEEPIVFHGNIISMILMYRKKSLLIHCLSKSRVN